MTQPKCVSLQCNCTWKRLVGIRGKEISKRSYKTEKVNEPEGRNKT